jgi:phosphoribosylamine--glycine ligase
MVRLESDLAEVILMALRGNILEREIRWNEKPSGCVVLCSGGYPLHYEKGKLIQGLEEVAEMPGITLFHAGTKWENDQYWTNGGRVIGVCASQRNLKETMKKIYQAIPHISFEGMHYRRDIGTRRQEA